MTHTAVWLTPHRLHFQTNGRSKQIIMVADIVELDVPKLCDHSLIWFREDQWECRLCLGHADTYSDLMNMIVTETS